MLQEALGLFRDMGDEPNEGLTINNIGGVYFAKGQFSEAQTQYERALQIREKVGNPRETADTLHNLGETLSKLGRYDQSLSRYLKALELRRAAEDRRGAAIEAYSIGTIFDYQGRYGAAIKSKEEALKTFRDIKQRDLWLAEALSGYGNSLSLSGRSAEADKLFIEALAVGKEIQNPTMLAQTMRFQAESLSYAGDLKARPDAGRSGRANGIARFGSQRGDALSGGGRSPPPWRSGADSCARGAAVDLGRRG